MSFNLSNITLVQNSFREFAPPKGSTQSSGRRYPPEYLETGFQSRFGGLASVRGGAAQACAGFGQHLNRYGNLNSAVRFRPIVFNKLARQSHGFWRVLDSSDQTLNGGG